MWRMLVRVALLLTALLFASSEAGFAKSFEANAAWTNRNGSTLTIQKILPDGSFTGSFTNRAGGACRNAPYAVTGWIDGQRIAFAVRWANATDYCEGITSWTGYLSDDGLLTRWIIVHLNRRGRPVFNTGTDVFH
jgi:hypothetical protein